MSKRVHLIVSKPEGFKKSGTLCPASRLPNRSIFVTGCRRPNAVTCAHCLRIYRKRKSAD